MAKRLDHTKDTKKIARQIAKGDRRALRAALRRDPDSVINYGPRGRAIRESH